MATPLKPTTESRADWLAAGDPAWLRCEADLDARGTPLPFWHRAAGAACAPGAAGQTRRLLALRGSDGSCRYALAVREGASRALPGHRILRVERLGAAGGGARDLLLAELVEYARREPRVLRVEVAALARGPARSELETALRRAGLRESRAPRFYSETVVVELAFDEEQILKSFHKQTRKNLRRLAREPFRVEALCERRFAPRLGALLAETLDRTGADHPVEDWGARLDAAAAHPERTRLVGLFREPGDGPEALLAFGWACHHGDHVEYCTTASTRIAGSRLPLTYALAWDLICWARAAGAGWFDFGGISGGGPDDPLSGISDFKRSFSQQQETVGSEWIFEPRPLRARLARAVTALARGGRR